MRTRVVMSATFAVMLTLSIAAVYVTNFPGADPEQVTDGPVPVSVAPAKETSGTGSVEPVTSTPESHDGASGSDPADQGSGDCGQGGPSAGAAPEEECGTPSVDDGGNDCGAGDEGAVPGDDCGTTPSEDHNGCGGDNEVPVSDGQGQNGCGGDEGASSGNGDGGCGTGPSHDINDGCGHRHNHESHELRGVNTEGCWNDHRCEGPRDHGCHHDDRDRGNHFSEGKKHGGCDR